MIDSQNNSIFRVLKRNAIMSVQELINKLEEIKKEYGNKQVVMRDPGSNGVINFDILGATETTVVSENWGYRAIKVDLYV